MRVWWEAYRKTVQEEVRGLVAEGAVMRRQGEEGKAFKAQIKVALGQHAVGCKAARGMGWL